MEKSGSARRPYQRHGAALSLALLILACMASGGCSLQYPEPSEYGGKSVFLPGSRDYVNRSASFKLTIDDAYLSAESAAKTRPGLIVEREPLFIVDRSYAFGSRGNNVLPLSGIYVNGDTGVYQFVESDSVIALVPGPHIAKK